MTLEDKRKGYIMCEICNEEGATEIKGGIYNDITQMWMICKKCVSKIEDRRKGR